MTLKQWREKRGWSLRAAGEHMGWSHARQFELEEGRVSPTLRTVDRVESLTKGAVTRLDWPKEEA